MRITIVVPILEWSGGARVIVGHAERLLARGHEVVIIAPGVKRGWRDWARTLLDSRNKNRPRPQTDVERSVVPLHVPQHLGPIIETDVPEADIIIATWWATAEWIREFGADKGVKVHFLQGYEAYPNTPTDRVEAVWRLPFFKIAIAQWLIDLGQTHFGISGMELVPNSIDDIFRRAEGPPRGDLPTVGFLYHDANVKDFPTTRATVERLREMRPRVRLIAFGSAKPAPGELPDDVEFHHLPPREVIARIYQSCDAWLSTSLTEGFNLPPIEAMASGCPAVCSKTGRPLEIIENGINGYLVDQGDVAGFADAIASILDLSDEAWQAMSAAARDTVAHPTWEESSALFEQALIRFARAEKAA